MQGVRCLRHERRQVMKTFATMLLYIGMINSAYMCTIAVLQKKTLFETGKMIFFVVFAITVFISGYGGGITRDLVLKRELAFLTASDCWLSTLIGCTLGLISNHKKHILQRSYLHDLILTCADDIGCVGFIIIGSTAATEMNHGICMGFLCGFLTAFGGGLIASLLNLPERKSITQVMLQALHAVAKGVIYFCTTQKVTTGQNIALILFGILIMRTLEFVLKRMRFSVSTATYNYHSKACAHTEIEYRHLVSLKHVRLSGKAQITAIICKPSYHRRCSVT